MSFEFLSSNACPSLKILQNDLECCTHTAVCNEIVGDYVVIFRVKPKSN